MALIPSSSAVQEKLERLRAEKAAIRAAFLAAVEATKVEWEAELLLALEEFRDAGGFTDFYKAVLAQFEIFNRPDHLEVFYRADHHGKPKGQKMYFKELLEQYYQNNTKRSNLVKRPGADDIPSLFLADKMDIKSMLYYGFEEIVFYGHEGPTMASERAALRYAMLKTVRNEILAPIQEEMRVEEEKDRAFNEECERRAAINLVGRRR